MAHNISAETYLAKADAKKGPSIVTENLIATLDLELENISRKYMKSIAASKSPILNKAQYDSALQNLYSLAELYLEERGLPRGHRLYRDRLEKVGNNFAKYFREHGGCD